MSRNESYLKSTIATAPEVLFPSGAREGWIPCHLFRQQRLYKENVSSRRAQSFLEGVYHILFEGEISEAAHSSLVLLQFLS